MHPHLYPPVTCQTYSCPHLPSSFLPPPSLQSIRGGVTTQIVAHLFPPQRRPDPLSYSSTWYFVRFQHLQVLVSPGTLSSCRRPCWCFSASCRNVNWDLGRLWVNCFNYYFFSPPCLSKIYCVQIDLWSIACLFSSFPLWLPSTTSWGGKLNFSKPSLSIDQKTCWIRCLRSSHTPHSSCVTELHHLTFTLPWREMLIIWQ